MIDRLHTGSGVAREVSLAAVGGIAPSTVRIPMPGFGVEFGVLPIGDSLPSGGENFLNIFGSEDFFGGTVADAVDACAQGFRGTDGVDGMLGSGVDVDGLSLRRGATVSTKRKMSVRMRLGGVKLGSLNRFNSVSSI